MAKLKNNRTQLIFENSRRASTNKILKETIKDLTKVKKKFNRDLRIVFDRFGLPNPDLANNILVVTAINEIAADYRAALLRENEHNIIRIEKLGLETSEQGMLLNYYMMNVNEGVPKDELLEASSLRKLKILAQEIVTKRESLINWKLSLINNAENNVSKVQTLLVNGVRNGTDYRDIVREAGRLTGSFTGRPLGQGRGKYSGYMANTIRLVRTEMRNIRSQATLVGAKELAKDVTGAIIVKIWNHGGGGNDPRDGHIALDSTKNFLEEDFVNPETGNSAEGPQQFGLPEEDIHCTCFPTTEIVLDKELQKITEDVREVGFDKWLEDL